MCGLYPIHRPPSLIYHAPWQDSIRASAIMLLDLKNMVIAAGILLPSRKAEQHFISLCTSGSRPPSLITHSPDKRQYLDQSSRVARHRKHSRWNCVAILCTSYFIINHFRFQAAIFDFSLTLTSSCTKIRPTMLFHTKDMRILLKFQIFTMSGLSFSGFTSAILISGWTRIELCTERCYYQQRWLWHPQTHSQQRCICF